MAKFIGYIQRVVVVTEVFQRWHFAKDRRQARKLIRANAHETADGISDAINRALAEFCGKDSYPDDVTFVVMKLWLDKG